MHNVGTFDAASRRRDHPARPPHRRKPHKTVIMRRISWLLFPAEHRSSLGGARGGPARLCTEPHVMAATHVITARTRSHGGTLPHGARIEFLRCAVLSRGYIRQRHQCPDHPTLLQSSPAILEQQQPFSSHISAPPTVLTRLHQAAKASALTNQQPCSPLLLSSPQPCSAAPQQHTTRPQLSTSWRPPACHRPLSASSSASSPARTRSPPSSSASPTR